MDYLRTWLTVSKRRYVLLYISLLLLFGIFSIFSMPAGKDDSYVYEDINSQYDNLLAALNILGDNVDVTKAINNENEKLVVNIVEQQNLIGRQKKNILFQEFKNYTDTSIEISAIRKEMYSLENYQEVAEFLLPEYQNELDNVYYKELKKEGKYIYPMKDNIMLVCLDFLIILGSFWFLISSLTTSDILVEEVEHLSVIGGYPEPFIKRLIKKITYTSLSTLAVFCLFIFTIGLFGLFFELGDIFYPIPIFTNHYLTVPFWKYIIIFILYSLVLSYFSSLLSVLFNYLSKSFFISFFMSSSLVVIPILFPSISKLGYYSPMHYLNISSLLTGELVSERVSSLTIYKGVIILLIDTLLLIIIISKVMTNSSLHKMRGVI